MSGRLRGLLISSVVVLAACVSETPQVTSPNETTTGPELAPPGPPPAQVPNPACAPVTAAEIEARIRALFSGAGWPDANSALSKFASVQKDLGKNDLAGARSATQKLVAFIDNKFGKLTASKQAAAQVAHDELVTALYCYVGLSGQVFDLNPGDPIKTFSIPGVGGVEFPANAVPVGTMVTLTDLSSLPSPLVTPLDTYASYLGIELFPPAVLPQPATVVLCSRPPAPDGVVVGHQDPTVGFEILDAAPVPASLQGVCGTTSGLAPDASPVRRLLARLTDMVLPSRLEAAPTTMMLFGGIGGLTSKFSPFGLVDPVLRGTDGIGSRTSGFAPRARPDAAPSASNPALPASYLQGTAGTTQTSGLPVVSVRTAGFDVDGVNPIPGVTVTFSTGASASYDPDSQARVCRVVTTTDAGGNPVTTVVPKDTVQVKTDANGNATLPCLTFGSVAGFANLAAAFDPTSLAFPNADLVSVTAVDDAGTGSSLNWLVKTDPGVPTQLGVVTAPSSTAAAGVPFAPQPVLRLLDALGNEVHQAGIAVTGTVTAGGGTATHSAVVTDGNGVVTFTDLTIGGAVAGTSQTVSFGFTGIAAPLQVTVAMVAGPAARIRTFFPPAAPALNFSYGTNLPAGVAVSPVPQVLVTDQFGNPVPGQAIFWSGFGAVLVVGPGAVTDAAGIARVTSWTPGLGLAELVASIYPPGTVPPAGYRPAQFGVRTIATAGGVASGGGGE